MAAEDEAEGQEESLGAMEVEEEGEEEEETEEGCKEEAAEAVAAGAFTSRPPSPTVTSTPPGPSSASEWSCVACTFLHAGRQALFLACDMCGAIKPTVQGEKSDDEDDGDDEDNKRGMMLHRVHKQLH